MILFVELEFHIFSLMFCCFSTKKKKHERKIPPSLPPKSSLKKESKVPKPSLSVISQKLQQESTHSNKLNQTQKALKHYEVIDSMIKEEIELEELRQEQKQSHKRQKKQSKFCDIQNESQNSRNNDPEEKNDDENIEKSSEESVEQHRDPQRKFKVTLSFENIGTLVLESRGIDSLDFTDQELDESKKQQYFELDQFASNHQDNDSSMKNQESAITLQNFHRALQHLPRKLQEELDDPLDETFQEAENGYYCREASIHQQFTRAVIAYSSPNLAKTLLQKMTSEQKNKVDSKGYTPVQLVVKKALRQKQYVNLAKIMAYQEDIDLECRNPSGWTPLQEALIYRNIPLSTHLFQAGYRKRQLSFRRRLSQLAKVLEQMPNFTIQIEVQIDSFIPLVGALAPSDTLRIKKVGSRIRLDYSLVGYQFPMCKRRQMSIFFDGNSMLGLNFSKGIYCDLLQDLDQQQMILIVQDMLTSEVKRGQPIMHEITLTKSLSLFDNQITEQFGNVEATKYQLNLRYTSTSEKRKSNLSNSEELSFLSNYQDYQLRKEEMMIKQKNRNKKMELEVWLAKDYGLNLDSFIEVLQILGAGNNLLSKWSTFLKDKIGQKMRQSNLFPIKIDVPLNYSLYFNIEFCNLVHLQRDTPALELPPTLTKVERKQYQGLLQSRDKRKLLLEAYT